MSVWTTFNEYYGHNSMNSGDRMSNLSMNAHPSYKKTDRSSNNLHLETMSIVISPYPLNELSMLLIDRPSPDSLQLTLGSHHVVFFAGFFQNLKPLEG